jgi:sulfatase maturation enzyme AslB (radical SAM superfamily)
MSNNREIKVLHLEPTNVCQAKCPLCIRETNINFDKKQKHHLSMQQILQVLDITTIANLDKMFMCGNYGDPAAGRFTLDIYQQFRTINKQITLGMNTNGALQSPEWWQQLGKTFSNPKDYVVFSIDGLEDTNHMYRIGVNWQQLMANAQAYISTGASAHWDMLVYQHNEHQIDSCRQMARDMGFKWFRAKVSKRPFLNGLKPPAMSIKTTSTASCAIKCHALEERSIYIDARGICYPCCWLGNDLDHVVADISDVASTWNTPIPNTICKQNCSTSNGITAFSAQWRIEEQLC